MSAPVRFQNHVLHSMPFKVRMSVIRNTTIDIIIMKEVKWRWAGHVAKERITDGRKDSLNGNPGQERGGEDKNADCGTS